MKNLRVTFTDAEHKKLKKIKGALSWHDFIMGIKEAGNNAPKK